MKSYLILLFSALIFAVFNPVNSHPMLLIGGTGDGKTHMCNTFEQNKCGQECHTMKSCTANSYIGEHCIDTPGFGENRPEYASIDNPIKGSLYSVKVLLESVDKTYIRSIVWVVGCLEHRIKLEEFLMTKLIVQMVGKPVPLVVVFNTVTPTTDHCEMDPTEFMSIAKEYDINIREVIMFKDFDLVKFENKYSQKYRVIIPENLQEILMKNDPSAELEQFRQLQCLSLPAQMTELHQHQSQLINEIKDDFDCPTPICNVPELPHVSCLHEKCAEYNWINTPFGKIRNGCARHETFADQGCVVKVTADAEVRNKRLDACIQASDSAVTQCLASLQRQNAYNDGIRGQLSIMMDREELINAKLRTCEKGAEPP